MHLFYKQILQQQFLNTAEVNALKLTDSSTVIDLIDVLVTDLKEKLPTSNAVQTYVESALSDFLHH